MNGISSQRRIWSACIAACALSVFFSHPVSANLIQNAGFEIGAASGAEPTSWGDTGNNGQESWAGESGTNGYAFWGWLNTGGALWQTGIPAYTNNRYYLRFRGNEESDFADTNVRIIFELYESNDSTLILATTNVYPSGSNADNVWTNFIHEIAATTNSAFVRPVLSWPDRTALGFGSQAFKWDNAHMYDRTLNYRVGEIAEEFSYDDHDDIDTLSGMSRGNGFTNNWSESTSGDYSISDGSFASMVGYPTNHGNKALVTPPNDNGRFAYRNIGEVNTGSIYIAFMMNFQHDGANKYAGASFMNAGTEEVFFGELYGQDNANNMGLTVTDVGDSTSTFTMNNGSGEDYLIIGHFDFNTRAVRAVAYYKTTTVPTAEPASWNASNTISVGVIPRIDGIRLGAGAGAGAGTPGNVYYDEVRVARSWKELMNQPAEPTWDGNGTNTSWAVPGNWVGNVVPATGTNVTFYDSVSSGANINLAGAQTALGLRFNDSADTSLSISSTTVGDQLTVNGGGIEISSGSGGSHSIATVTMGADQTWTNGSTQDFSITNRLRGTGNLTKTGQGRVILSYGGTASDFSGTVTVNNGPLRIVKATSLSDTTAGTTVNSGGALELAPNSGTTYSSEPLTLSGTGVANGGALRSINNNNTWSGPITLGAAARINCDANSLTLDNAAAIDEAFGLTFGGAGNITNLTQISIGANTVTKDGAGKLALTTDNSGYTGATFLNEGSIRASHQYALGWLTTGTTVSNGTALELIGGITINEPLTLNGTGISGGGALRNISGTTTYGGAIALATASRINSDSGVLSLGADADISGAGIGLTVGGAGDTEIWGDMPTGAAAFTKDGTGTLLLYRFGGAVRSWTGATTISAGTNKLMSADAISDSSAVTVASGATLYLNANNDTVGSIAGAGAIIGGGTLTAGGDNSSTIYSGVMSAGAGLTKTGSGTLTLTGSTSTANGNTTVSAGTLIQNGTNASSPVTVNSGGFLYGRGELNNLTINGRASAGVASNTVGALKAAWLMLENNGTLQVELSAMIGTAGTDWDVVNASGALLVNAADGNDFVIALKGNPTFNSALGYTNTIMTSANLSSFAANKFTINTTEFTPSLNGGTFTVVASGNDIRLMFIPLPTPDIAVLGTNLATIADGDATPQLGDGTDFGNVSMNGGTKTHTYTITNIGTGPLFVDTVAIGGAAAADFTVLTQPDSWVVANLVSSNADFESGNAGWNFIGGNYEFRGEYYGLYPKRGTNMLTLWADNLAYQDFPVSASSNYTLSVWYSSPAQDGLSGDRYGEMKVEWYNDAGANLGTDATTFNTSGTRQISIGAGQWYNLSTNVTAPSGATTGRVAVVAWDFPGAGGGRAMYDHIQFFKQPGLGSTKTFDILFNPSAVGARAATVYITNNVSGKSPYDFAIRGTGTWADMFVSPLAFTTNTAAGGNPGPFTFGVTNTGNGTMAYNVTTGYSVGGTAWATNSPGTGSLGASAGQQHTITFGTYALTAGTYYVTNTITDAGASNSPRTVVVTLNVTNGPAVGLIYDWFPNTGRLNGQGGGNGWGANTWIAGDDDDHIYGTGGFATNKWSVHGTSGNKAQLVCTANGVQHWADRYFGTPFTNGIVYIAWMQNYDHKGEGTLNTALAGIFILDTNGTERPFIGKMPFTNALGFAYNGSPHTNSSRTMENGPGTNYFCVAKYDFATRELSASAYSTNDMVAEEPHGYWDLTVTLTAGCVRSIGGIRIKGGVDSSDALNNAGNVYFDEIRVGTNFYMIARSQGETDPSILVDGPAPTLIFLGTNYTVGATNSATVTDAQLANTSDKLDFAILWSNQYGVFLTNHNTSFNIGSRSGRVSPNWDPFSLSGSGVTNSLNLDTNFTGFIGGNGAQTVTTYVQNAFSITSSAVGDTYFLTASAENNNTNNGFIISPSSVSTVPVMRALTINSQLVFTVTDDDSSSPVMVAPSLGVSVGSTQVGNLLTDPGFDSGTPWILYSLASARITNTAGEGSGNGIKMEIGAGTNDHGGFYQTYTIAENISRRYIFSIRGKDGAQHFDCSQLVLKFEFLDVNFALIYSVETDIVNQVTTDWQTFTFSATSTANSVYVRPIVDFNTANGTVGTIGRSNMWDNARLHWATEGATNPILRVTDGQLAQASAANPFSISVGAYDSYSGLSRGTNSVTTQSFISVANLTTNNVTNYNPGASTTAATNDGAISVWTWSNALGAATIQNFMAASNIVVSTVRDADSDRTDDQLSLSNRTAGYFVAVDDDTNGPLKGYTKLTELLQDTSFEAHLANVWTNYADPGSTAEFNAVSAETGSFGLMITNNQTVAYAAQWVNVSAGSTYILSVRAKKAGTLSQDGYYVKAEQWNGGSSETTHYETNIFNSLTTSFQTFSVTFTAPVGTTSNKIVFIQYNPGAENGNGAVYFDDASFKASVGPPISIQMGSTNYIGSDETTNAVYNLTDGDLGQASAANPFRVILAAYDADSGLARTNVAGSEGTNTSITVVNLTTNNVTNYVSSESSLLPTITTHTNSWRWDDLSTTARDSLYAAGSNAIRATLKDADMDRTADQLSVSNMLLGYLRLSDDDTGVPVLSGFYQSSTSAAPATTTLSAGDIAILGYQSATPDTFSFVNLVPLSQSTVIRFSDGGWLAASGFRSGEGLIHWTNNTGADLPFGTIVTITNVDNATPGASTGGVGRSALGGTFNLASPDDQILAYQDTGSSTTFIFAVNWNGGVWQADATDANSSALPTGLTNGVNAIALGSLSSNVYNMATTNGTRAQLLAAIANTANWTRVGVVLPPAGAFSLRGQITDGDLFNGGWFVGGLVQDTGSGINSNSAVSGPDFGVNYDLWSPNDVQVFTDAVFQIQQSDGGGRVAPTSIASSVSAVPAAVNSLGIWTVRVSAADNDDDRTSDRDVVLDSTVLSFNVIDDDTTSPVRVNVTGVNLLSNSSFEAAGWWEGIARGWDATNYPTDIDGATYGNYFRTDYRAHGGSYAASIPGRFGPNTEVYGGWYQDVTNSYGNGVTWQASVWARSDQGWTGYCAVAIEFYALQTDTRLSAVTNVIANPSNGWVYASVSGTNPPGTFWARIVVSGDAMGTNGSIYYDDAVLQVATNVLLPMDMTINGISYYRDGTSTNGNFQVSDADLASLATTNLLKFVYRVYDPVSGVGRTNTAEKMNYDLGAVPTLTNIYWTYSNSLSTLHATNSSATSIFVHVSNFTVGGVQGTNFIETGEVYQLLVAVSNGIGLSYPNDDEDRGITDREWVYDERFGYFVAYDDDGIGPYPSLKYIGTNYAAGTIQSNVLTDAEMIAGGLDFAYDFADASGVLLTNNNATTNTLAEVGNVSPNWELKGPSGVEYGQDSVHPRTSLFAIAGNGSEFATAVQYNVSFVVYTNNATGTWYVQTSVQDMDNDRGTIVASNGQTVSFDRSIRANWGMGFSVIDDDAVLPVQETTNFALGSSLRVYMEGTSPGGNGSGPGTNRLFTITDEDMLGLATTAIRVVFNTYDAYSGIARGANQSPTNMNITIENFFTNNVTNFNLSRSSTVTTNGSATSEWVISFAPTTSVFNLLFGTTSRVSANIPDADTDRIGDQSWVSNQQYGFIRWVDDDSDGPQLRTFGAGFNTNSALKVFRGGNPGLNFNGRNVWQDPAPVEVTNANARFLLTDGDLASVSNGWPLDFLIWAYDSENGLSRGPDPSTNTSVSIGSTVVSNVGGYVASNSSVYSSTKNLQFSTNLWRFTNFTYSQVGNMYTNFGGSNRLTLHALNGDFDRGTNDQDRADTNMGWMVVSDDDTADPFAYNLIFNGHDIGVHQVTDAELTNGPGFYIRLADNEAGVYTAAANGAFSPPHFDLINGASLMLFTNEAFDVLTNELQLLNQSFELVGTNANLATNWFINTDMNVTNGGILLARTNADSRIRDFSLCADYNGATNNREEVAQWYNVSGLKTGEVFTFGGWLKINGVITGGQALVKMEWWDAIGGNLLGYDLGTFHTDTGNQWVNTIVSDVKSNASFNYVKCIVEVNHIPAGSPVTADVCFDDMYVGAYYTVRAQENAVTIAYTNRVLGTWAFQWTGQDADNDRTNDTLAINDSTNVTGNGYQFTVVDDFPGSPTGLNLWLNSVDKEATNVSDQQIRNGVWYMEMRITDPSGVVTSNVGDEWAPTYSLLNAAGTMVQSSNAWTSLTPYNSATNIQALRVMPGVNYADVDLGWYSVLFSAQNTDNDRPNDRGALTNFAGMGEGGTNGHQFWVYDDDTNAPSIVTNVAIDIVGWTNINLFNITFNSATDDLSGVYQYRFDTNVTPSVTVTDGVVVSGVATSILPVAALTNKNFEIGGLGQAVPNYDPDPSSNLYGWADFSSDRASGMYWNVAQSGTSSMRCIVDSGDNLGDARFSLVGQQVPIENTNNYPVLASMTAWFKGDLSQAGVGGLKGAAFLKMEFYDANTAKLLTVDNEYGSDHNGQPLYAVNEGGWTNVTITATNGPSNTRFMRFMMGVAQHDSDLPYTGYWDNVSVTVRVIGAVGTAYSFQMTNALEGVRTNWLFAVDDDDDRLNDRLKAANTSYLTRLDQTGPPKSLWLAVTGGLDEATEMQLTWSAVSNAGNRAGDDEPLSPWRTYHIFYEECTNCNVTTNSPSISFTTSGYTNLGTNATTMAIISNLNFDTTYRFAIAGRDQAGNIGTLSDTATLSTLNFIVTQGIAAAASRVDISWMGKTNNVYDVLWVDGLGYSDSYSNLWTNLMGTVTNSFISDTGSVSRLSPQDMTNGLRFYRVSRPGQWSTGAVPRRASKEIYVSKAYVLVPGENWISMPMLPDTNRTTAAQIFGTNRLPSGSTIATATKMSWYGHTLAVATNTAGAATNVIWLSTSGGWQFSVGQAGPANNWVVPTNEGFNVEIPGSVTQRFVLVGRLPTSSLPAVIYGQTSETNFSVMSYSMPYRVAISNLGLKGAGFVGGTNPQRSDEIRILDNSQGLGSLTAPKRRIWLNSSTNFVFAPPYSGSAESYVIEPGEAIIFVRKRAPSIIWTNQIYYSIPGKNVNP